MIELLGTIAGILAIAGVILNNHIDRRCFYLWMISNLMFFLIHVNADLISLAVRDLAFTVLAFHGLYKWHKLQRSWNDQINRQNFDRRGKF